MIPLEKNILNHVPKELLDKWAERMQEEKQNRYVEVGESCLIDYSDFTDLKNILNKGKNHKLFSDLISQEDLKVITSKLHELDPLRKKIAHSRPLTQKEFEKLRMYSEEINTVRS